MSRKDRKRRQAKKKRKARKEPRVQVKLATAPYAGRQVPLERMDEVRWRVPRSGPMHVDGIVYALEELLPDLKSDRCLNQVANVATLPGIVGHSLAMPDIHWGYGFPIGGVAAFDPDGGIVSPGGVGYDINCLAADTRVLGALGYTRAISEVVEEEVRAPVALLDLDKHKFLPAEVVAGLASTPRQPVLELETAFGRRITATTDHPILTPTGMEEAGSLAVGDLVATLAFQGVPYEPPSNLPIVTETLLRDTADRLGKTDSGRGLTQALKRLDDLLPLTLEHPALPTLLKVAGYVLGDGAIHWETARKKGRVVVYGEPEDLRQMASDLRPWFKASQVYSRPRSHEADTTYGQKVFTSTEHSMRIGSTGMTLLFAAMGLPVGRRTDQDWELPGWLSKAPLWQQRLFLAGFFGAEMSSPKAFKERGTCFYAPALCIHKREGYLASGQRFLEQIADTLTRFGVQVLKISTRKEQVNPDGSQSERIRLLLSSRTESLIALWGSVGFEYNAKRARLAAQAVAYLQKKQAVLNGRSSIRSRARELHRRHGWGAKRIHATLALQGSSIGVGFIWSSIQSDPPGGVRVSKSFPRFHEWLPDATRGLGDSGAVWERIETIRERSDVDRVYDITVDHPDHDFVANGFVVHNCGVRLLASDVSLGDVTGKMKDLTQGLFRAIPAGVGSSRSELKLGDDDLADLMTHGVGWARRKGYATVEDEDRIEENGCIRGAEPKFVSARAKQRGRSQLGTLGSGNHFAEVGVVDEVFDADSAEAFGLREGQITLMIHSGSRGLGHQVCTDFLSDMLRASNKYGIDLVDRQLCSAPIGSDEATRYLGAMAAAANFAFNNRQLMTHWARHVFEELLGASLRTVYDVCHNIAKYENHDVDGQSRRLLVHRKGATRALPKGHVLLPESYRDIGQPVIIPGDMGRYSFVLKGAERSDRTFGSACHGAGRLLSRSEAKRRYGSTDVAKDLEKNQGIIVIGSSRATVVEEVPQAYKDVAEVVDVVHQGGLAEKVARLRPLGVVKG